MSVSADVLHAQKGASGNTGFRHTLRPDVTKHLLHQAIETDSKANALSHNHLHQNFY